MDNLNFIEQKYGSFVAIKVEEILNSLNLKWKDVSKEQLVELGSIILDVIDETEDRILFFNE